MTAKTDYARRAMLSAQRALSEQTPDNLRAYSFMIDFAANEIVLRAHFYAAPSDDDLDDIGAVDAEIDCDFLDELTTRTEIEISPLGITPEFLPDGLAFSRDMISN